MISDELINYIEMATGIDHQRIDDISEDELHSDCVMLVFIVPFRGKEKYIKRIKTKCGNWYADEINEDEYMELVIKSHIEMVKKAQKISDYSAGLDFDSLMKKAQDQLDAEAAFKEEKETLPEDELIDEDAFKKMWGQ